MPRNPGLWAGIPLGFTEIHPDLCAMISSGERAGVRWLSTPGTATTMVAALQHGRNSLGVECPSPHPMGRGIKGEVSVNFKLAASRLMNENSSLFGQARCQIELKPHGVVETVAVLAEKAPP